MRAVNFLSASLLILMIVACGDSSKPSIVSVTADSPGTNTLQDKSAAIKVAFVMKSLTNPFFVEMAKGARLAQQETGIDLQIKTATPETSVEQQIRIIDGQIKAHVNAIVISPVDITQLVPVLKRAQDAGIKIVNIDERLHPDALAANRMKPVPFVGVDSEQAAYLAARFIADQVKLPTEAAIIEGIPGTNTAMDRKRGVERAFGQNSKLRVVATGVANWKADEAYELARSLFKAHPKIGVVYCANDMMAIGLIKYLQESGRTKVLVGGFDALDQARDAIRAGQMAATVDQRADRQGYLGVVNALKLIRAEAVPDVVLIDTALVTADTLN
ncbi:MAG: substrate-binding domain-containing protein [Proteobacteria bacterium]|nr:substrate-binding domain-containing protein [Pseudomonadota bacterium]